jgi:hypothetical protein
MKTFVKLATLAPLTALAVACAAPTDPQDSASEVAPSTTLEAEAVSPDDVFTDTIVDVKEDGSYDIKTKLVTLAERQAEIKIREAIAAGIPVERTLAWDSGCASSSHWLYDQPNTPLTANRICFRHPAYDCDTHDLSQFTRGTITCGGSTYTTRWAGGIVGCGPLGIPTFAATTDLNAVRSIWTGSNAPSGKIDAVSFYNQNGTFQNQYIGTNTQFPNVSTSGRDVKLCGKIIN